MSHTLGDSRPVRVLKLIPKRLGLASRNTDLRYLNELNIPGTKSQTVGGPGFALTANLKYAASSLRYRYAALRAGGPESGLLRWGQEVRLSNRRLGDIDVVMSNYFLPEQLHGIPFVLEYDFLIHGFPKSEFAENLQRMRQLVCTWISEHDPYVVVRSSASQLALRQLVPGHSLDRTTVIQHYLPYLSTRAERPEAPQGRPLRVIFVGHNALRKGLPNVARAVQVLNQQGRGLQLTVVSTFRDGPPPKLPVGTNVVTDAAPHDVARLLKAHDVLVMPSPTDSQGLVFNEALSQGCAVVYPSRNPMIELFAGCGLGVECSPEGVSVALAKLDSNRDELHRYQSNALNVFENHFNPEVVASQYSRLFLRCLHDGGDE